MAVRIGVIGTGSIAQLHIPALRAAGAHVVAVAGVDRAAALAFGRSFSIESAFDNLDDILEGAALDGVVIATPSDLHVPQTLAAIAAGIPALCEIPLATSLEDAQLVTHASRTADVSVMVAHTLRFCDAYVELHHRVQQGMVVEHLVSRRQMLRQVSESWTHTRRNWTDSILWHHTVHQLDLALWLLSDPAATMCGGAGRPWTTNGQVMDVSASLRTSDGRLGTLSLSYHARIAKEDLLVITTEHTYEVIDGALYEDGRLLNDQGSDDIMKLGGILRQDAAFVAALEGGHPPAFQAEDAIPTMTLIDQLSRSPLREPEDLHA